MADDDTLQVLQLQQIKLYYITWMNGLILNYSFPLSAPLYLISPPQGEAGTPGAVGIRGIVGIPVGLRPFNSFFGFLPQR